MFIQYMFTVVVSKLTTAPVLPADARWSFDEGYGRIIFTRWSDSMHGAVLSAIKDVDATGAIIEWIE